MKNLVEDIQDGKLALFLSIQQNDHARFRRVMDVMRPGSFRALNRIRASVNDAIHAARLRRLNAPCWYDIQEKLVGEANDKLVRTGRTPWGHNPMRFLDPFLGYSVSLFRQD